MQSKSVKEVLSVDAPEFVNTTEAVDLIRKSDNKFFTVAFTKRTDNTLRTMNARLNVKKTLKGRGSYYVDPSLMHVYDMTNKAYRTINLSGMRWLKIKGKTYVIIG